MAKAKKAPHIKNRIVKHSDVLPGKLLENPLNWRIHSAYQSQAVSESLKRLGWIKDVIVNQTTGHILDGHLRVTLALEENDELVPVSWVKLTVEEEKLALATLDPLAELADMSGQKLADLLDEVDAGKDPLGEMLAELQLSAGQVTFNAGGGVDPRANLGRQPVVKLVLAVDKLDIVERALSMVGHPNRGEALAHICAAYIEAQGT